ncbi:transcriptional regulator [Verminephrobacter aporrectodeae subsp. tuberculatae]|uniref:ATP-binding protein n=1 Tax=Verminephrobacter aporrectodeae TaxID=1110389 RepID=UPI0022439599|nr:ATP-binding protein [Verminephrobacter aporrectodeae]MCW8205649.1 transcriptional regulator [Verminephrobacter aporrectodeae subsp. tuberculatae]
MRLSDEDLEALLANPESDRSERKEAYSRDVREKLCQAICAFANDLPGHRQPGVVFVGVRDDGTPVNLAITGDLLETLAGIRADGNIQPIPSMTVEKRTLLGAEVAVVTVHPSDAPPVRYKGRTYIRVGPRGSIAGRQDESILNERRRHRDLPFDLQPVPLATLADLSRVVFESEYLTAAFAADVLEANDRTYEERLTACRMIESVQNPVPTVMGSLVLATRTRDLIPCAYVQFLRVDGPEWDAPILDEAAIDGRMSEVIRRLDDKLRAHISTSVDVHSADTEKRRPDYPLAALQQLARNAIMHRSYEGTHAPIRVTWFSDRIEILNPGGPYGVVTVANFGQAGVTDYRNPHLAEAMKTQGYVQRFGVGIATARRLLRENGNPPAQFDPQETRVLVTVRK